MDKNIVSIIIPAFNSAVFILDTIESVTSQTYTNWELLIVDDGSTDNTKELVENLSLIDSRVIYFRQKNAGQASARNVGVKNSKGKYIAFLDSDDLWKPKKLEKQVEILDNFGQVDVVFTKTDTLKNTEVIINQSKINSGFISHSEIFNRLYEASDVTNSSVLVRKSCFDKTGFFNESTALRGTEDYDMWLRLASNGANFFFLNESLTIYRIHPNSTSQNRQRMVSGVLSIYKQYDLSENISHSLRLKKYRDYYREKITLEVRNKTPKLGIQNIILEFYQYDNNGVITSIQKRLFSIFSPRFALFISQVFLYRILAKFVE